MRALSPSCCWGTGTNLLAQHSVLLAQQLNLFPEALYEALVGIELHSRSVGDIRRAHRVAQRRHCLLCVRAQRRHACEHERETCAAQRVLQQLGEHGIAIRHVRVAAVVIAPNAARRATGGFAGLSQRGNDPAQCEKAAIDGRSLFLVDT